MAPIAADIPWARTNTSGHSPPQWGSLEAHTITASVLAAITLCGRSIKCTISWHGYCGQELDMQRAFAFLRLLGSAFLGTGTKFIES